MPAIYSLIVEVILFPTWGAFIFGISEFPEWAASAATNNSSSQCP